MDRTFRQRITEAWAAFRGRVAGAVACAQGSEEAPNPYLTAEEADAVYETLENGLHALWPLLLANEYGGTLAARGIVWGALYAFTWAEDEKDQRGLAWELARLVRDYLPADQAPEELPGVSVIGEDGTDDGDLFAQLTSEQKPGVYRIQGEILAFMDSALGDNHQSATNVVNAVRTRLGAMSHVRGHYSSLEEAEKAMAINFMGSCLASVASKYAENEVGGVNQ